MLVAIFRKEFFKIRWAWLLVLLANIGLMAYVAVSTRRLFMLDHPEVVWYRVLHLGQIHFDTMMYLPLLSGILIACFQFLPEMWGERFRLSLHLPVTPGRIAMAHLIVGLVAYTLTALMDLFILMLITATYFPIQGVATSLVTALPWTMAGAAAYLGGALTLLEPNYRLKAVNLGLGAGVAGLYMVNGMPGAYGPSLLFLVLPLALLMSSILLPVLRFRYRRVG
ncbi:MAG: hypothetical protein CSA29_05500 [Desulfobacterales bacterium]|nr:MAG: hypothetical protein CSA29_05500 [Desulfobacterales bacterium]